MCFFSNEFKTDLCRATYFFLSFTINPFFVKIIFLSLLPFDITTLFLFFFLWNYICFKICVFYIMIITDCFLTSSKWKNETRKKKQFTFLIKRIAVLCWFVSWTQRGSSSSSGFRIGRKKDTEKKVRIK